MKCRYYESLFVCISIIIIYFALNSAIIKQAQTIIQYKLKNKRNEIVTRTKRSIVNSNKKVPSLTKIISNNNRTLLQKCCSHNIVEQQNCQTYQYYIHHIFYHT